MKSLDLKLADILANPSSSKEFILADAKDGDMAFGIAAPGRLDGRWKTLEEYRDQMREIVRRELVDIMLMSASTLEQLAIKEGLFKDSPVTPAARANDTTDIWVVHGSRYPQVASRPFRSASIDHIQYGTLNHAPDAEIIGANLGLYSLTFGNDLDRDHATLSAFKEFRDEAEMKGFRYFLEVFEPNAPSGVGSQDVPFFMNDHIVRTLAGVPSAGRPLFLKIPYMGPQAMEELASYDPALIVGVLGGSAGTTYDAFRLIHDARKHGARVALFGRKINHSEHPVTFIEMLWHIVRDELTPTEAVNAYHGELEKLGIAPMRDLHTDLELTDNAGYYGGSE